MLIKFDAIQEKELQNFYGGDGALIANMFVDEKNKILRGKLAKGSSIGLHRHVPTSETIFILSGTGKAVCDGVEEYLSAGDCHHCPKGSEHTLINVGEEDLCFYAVVPQQ
ncbi:MAG: cupin domain-containing protein [Clostridiales bacterium]|nr:cupin domain-containing protein [Clostridiales bacterium]